MELLINREYVLRPKYDGSRSIRIAKHIIMVAEDEARLVNDYYGKPIYNPQELLETHDVEPLYTYECIEDIYSELQRMINTGAYDTDIIRLAKEFAKKYNDGHHVVFGEGALTMRSYKLVEEIIIQFANGNFTKELYVSPFTYQIGEMYLTQGGEYRQVLGRTFTKGYEAVFTLAPDFEAYPFKHYYKYDRSTAHKGDTGRCTGSWHEYTDRENFLREDYGNRFELFQEACVQLNVNPKTVDTTRLHPLPELNKRIFALMGGSLLDAKS